MSLNHDPNDSSNESLSKTQNNLINNQTSENSQFSKISFDMNGLSISKN